MENPIEKFLTLATKLDDIYESLRIRSLCVRHSGRWISLSTRITFLPYKVEKSSSTPYPGNFLCGFEAYLPFPSTNTLLEWVYSGEIDFGEQVITLDHYQENPSSWYFWPTSKMEVVDGIKYEYPGLYLRGYFSKPDNFPTQDRLDIETRLNPKTRFESLAELSKVFLGREIDIIRDSTVHIEMPYWTQIKHLTFSGNRINMVFSCPRSLIDRVKLRIAFLLEDDSVRIHPLKKKTLTAKNLLNDSVEISKQIIVPDWAQSAQSANLTIALDDSFALENQFAINLSELNPTFHLMQSFDESMLDGSTFNQWLRGKKTTGGRKMDRFEYAVSVLFTSLGFTVILPGPLGLEGIDVVAYHSKRRIVLVLECSEGKVSRKAAGCYRAIKQLRKAISRYNIIGVVVTSGVTPSIDRNQLETDNLRVIDSDDLDTFYKLAYDRQNPEEILRLLGILP